MKTYKVYTPWDSIIVEAKDETAAKRAALRRLQTEIEFADKEDLDAEEMPLEQN